MSAPKTASLDDRLRQLSCVSCGYLLHAHGADDRCPECGGTVRLTIDAQRLGTWPAAWLRRLRLGLRLLIAATAAGWLVMCWFTVTDLSGFGLTLPWAVELRALRSLRNERLLTLPMFGAFLLGTWGTIAITFSEAARTVGSERPRASWLAKVGIAVGALAFLGLTAPFLMTGRARSAVILIWFAVFIAGAVATWNLATFLARLARRMPDGRLARRCESFRWVAMLVIVLASCDAASFWPVLTWLPISTSRAWWRSLAIMETLILVGRFGLLIAGVLAVALLRAYAGRLGAILRAAPERGTTGS